MSPKENSQEITRQFEIKNTLGLHARAAAAFVKIANRFQAEIMVKKSNLTVDGKRIMGVLMLAAAKGSKIEVLSKGADAQDALAAIEKLIDNKFGEE